MVEQDMMQPHWPDYFQPAWRKGLAKCNESRQAIMYLAALQVQCPLVSCHVCCEYIGMMCFAGGTGSIGILVFDTAQLLQKSEYELKQDAGPQQPYHSYPISSLVSMLVF